MVLERIKVKIKNTNSEAKPINIFSEKISTTKLNTTDNKAPI